MSACGCRRQTWTKAPQRTARRGREHHPPSVIPLPCLLPSSCSALNPPCRCRSVRQHCPHPRTSYRHTSCPPPSDSRVRPRPHRRQTKLQTSPPLPGSAITLNPHTLDVSRSALLRRTGLIRGLCLPAQDSSPTRVICNTSVPLLRVTSSPKLVREVLES